MPEKEPFHPLARFSFDTLHKRIEDQFPDIALRPHTEFLPHLSNIKETELFTKYGKYEDGEIRRDWVVWSDYDGVFYEPWNENQLVRIRALESIAQHTSIFRIITLRMGPLYLHEHYPQIRLGMYEKKPYHMPLFSYEHQVRWERILTRNNEKCAVKFYFGLDKLFTPKSEDTFAQKVIQSLKEDHPVVLIGSSIVDRNRFTFLLKKLAEAGIIDASKLFYIDTGHIFV